MAGKIRKHFTDDQIIKTLDEYEGSLVQASRKLSQIGGVNVSCPVLCQWANQLGYKFFKKTEPKILLFDIETTPLKAYAWGLFNQNISINQIIEDWKMICWSAKWLGDKKIINANIGKTDEFNVVADLWDLLDQADYVVAHNGDRFDVKKMNAKFLEFGLGNPSYYKTVDTLKIAKGNLSLTSNKLDWIAKALDCDRKIKTDFNLWERCMNGDISGIDEMQRYCDQDVMVLEEVYRQIRYLDKRTPHMSVYTENAVCNGCGSENIYHTGEHITSGGVYQVYQCVDCSHNTKIKGNVLPNKNRGVSV